jgi:hypothetical protein
MLSSLVTKIVREADLACSATAGGDGPKVPDAKTP